MDKATVILEVRKFQEQGTAKATTGLEYYCYQHKLWLTELKSQKSDLGVPRDQFIHLRLKHSKPLILLDLIFQT